MHFSAQKDLQRLYETFDDGCGGCCTLQPPQIFTSSEHSRGVFEVAHLDVDDDDDFFMIFTFYFCNSGHL